MDNLDNDIKHKILFFFMPKSIVFTKKDKKDTESVAMLKSVSPCFYWCSGHEFLTKNEENRYLIQYQIYFINGKNMEPATINQEWYKSKNDIRKDILLFLDMWQDDHQKILLNPNDDFSTANNISNLDYLNKVYNFSDFASFVAKSIFALKDIYIEQANAMNFDIIQKEFWRQVALDPQFSKEIQNFFKIEDKILTNKSSITKAKQGRAKEIKNENKVRKKNTKTS